MLSFRCVYSHSVGKMFGRSPIFVLGDLGGVLPKPTCAMQTTEIREGQRN